MSLIKNGIGPVGAAQIAAPLAACAKLREINLFRNQLLDAGAETLCSALAAGACNLEVRAARRKAPLPPPAPRGMSSARQPRAPPLRPARPRHAAVLELPHTRCRHALLAEPALTPRAGASRGGRCCGSATTR